MIIPTPLLQRLVRAILGWFDTRAEAPIMRQRINAGSDHYFRHAHLTKGESELDDILGSRTTDDDDESPDTRRHDEVLADEFASTRRSALLAGVMLAVSVIYLLGIRGTGPLGEILSRFSQQRLVLLISSGVLCVASSVQLVRRSIQAVRLRRELADLRRSMSLPDNSTDLIR